MGEDLDDLARAAADALVSAMATDSWEAVKRRFADLIGHERRMDAARTEVVAASGPDRGRVQLAQARAWSTRMRDVLDDDPAAAEGLRALLAGLGAAPQAAAAASQHAQADHGSQAVNVGGNITGSTGEVYVGVGKVDKRKLNIVLAPVMFLVHVAKKIAVAHPVAVTATVVVIGAAGVTGWQTHWPPAVFGATSSVGTGHDTPEDAVNGFLQAAFARNWAQVCSYLAPSFQETCNGGATQLPTFTGSANVAGGTISGHEALVAVTGSICANGTCTSNSDPSTGMPNSQETFAQAYSRVLNSGDMSPVPCIEQNGMWYVNATQ